MDTIKYVEYHSERWAELVEQGYVTMVVERVGQGERGCKVARMVKEKGD